MNDATLDDLDDLLVRIRVAQQRPEWRRRLMSGSAYQLGLSELRVLRAVERRSDASIGEVAEDLGIEHSTASRAVTQVVRTGFLVKSSSPRDQRRTSLEVTEIGRQALRDMTMRRRAMVAEVIADWSDADLTSLTTLLARLADDFESEQA